MSIINFCLDYDDTAVEALIYRTVLPSSIASHRPDIVSANLEHPLIQDIIKKIIHHAEEAAPRGEELLVIISNGSNRQTADKDRGATLGMMSKQRDIQSQEEQGQKMNSFGQFWCGQRNLELSGEGLTWFRQSDASTYSAISSFQGLQALAYCVWNYFATCYSKYKITFTIDLFLLGDSSSLLEPGTVWKNTIRKINDPSKNFPERASIHPIPDDEEAVYVDDIKLIATYVRLQRFAEIISWCSERRQSFFYFYDDNSEIVDTIHRYYSNEFNPLIPLGLQLHLVPYKSKSAQLNQTFVVMNHANPVSGPIPVVYNHNWLCTIKRMNQQFALSAMDEMRFRLGIESEAKDTIFAEILQMLQTIDQILKAEPRQMLEEVSKAGIVQLKENVFSKQHSTEDVRYNAPIKRLLALKGWVLLGLQQKVRN